MEADLDYVGRNFIFNLLDEQGVETVFVEKLRPEVIRIYWLEP